MPGHTHACARSCSHARPAWISGITAGVGHARKQARKGGGHARKQARKGAYGSSPLRKQPLRSGEPVDRSVGSLRGLGSLASAGDAGSVVCAGGRGPGLSLGTTSATQADCFTAGVTLSSRGCGSKTFKLTVTNRHSQKEVSVTVGSDQGVT